MHVRVMENLYTYYYLTYYLFTKERVITTYTSYKKIIWVRILPKVCYRVRVDVIMSSIKGLLGEEQCYLF